MYALLFDEIKDEEFIKKSGPFFFYQEKEDPSLLRGPLFLKRTDDSNLLPNLSISPEGKVVKSKSDFFVQTKSDLKDLSIRLVLLTDLFKELEKESQSLKNSQSSLIRDSVEYIQKKSEDFAEEAVLQLLEKKKSIFMRGKWIGDDIGSTEDPITHIYSKGEHYGFRLENVYGVPENSGKNVGRLLFNTVDEKVYCDVGYKMKRISSEKFEKDFILSEPQTLKIDLSGSDIDDARKTVWQVCDNQNSFRRLHALIQTPDAKTVLIDIHQAGTYRVLGVE